MVAVRNCERCGGEFARSPKYSESQWASKRFCSRRCGALRRNFSDDEIVQLYKSGLSSTEISQLVRVSATHVSRIVNCYGAMRSPSERIVLSHSQSGSSVPREHKRNSARADRPQKSQLALRLDAYGRWLPCLFLQPCQRRTCWPVSARSDRRMENWSAASGRRSRPSR